MEPFMWQYVACGLGAIVAVLIALKLYDRRETRREIADQAADAVRELGFDLLADLFKLYVRGDYSGIARVAKDLVKLCQNKTELLLRLDKLFWNLLEHAITDPGKLAKIEAKIAESKKPSTQVAP